MVYDSNVVVHLVFKVWATWSLRLRGPDLPRFRRLRSAPSKAKPPQTHRRIPKAEPPQLWILILLYGIDSSYEVDLCSRF